MLAAVLVFSAESCPDSKTLPRKDWRQWSQADCERILHDSPWAQSSRSDAPASDGAYSYYFSAVRFYSALPIRQAIVRRLQIENGYETIEKDEERDLFDRQTARILSQDFNERIVLHFVYRGDVVGLSRDKPSPLGDKAALVLSDGTFVLATEMRRIQKGSQNLALHRALYEELEIVFPRKPDIQLERKSVTFVFGVVVRGSEFRPYAEFEFPISKMVYKGKLEL